MFDGLIVNLAIFQDNLTDALVDLSLLLLIKKIEVQICRESRQIVENMVAVPPLNAITEESSASENMSLSNCSMKNLCLFVSISIQEFL